MTIEKRNTSNELHYNGKTDRVALKTAYEVTVDGEIKGSIVHYEEGPVSAPKARATWWYMEGMSFLRFNSEEAVLKALLATR